MYFSPKFLFTFNRIRQPLNAAHSAGTDQTSSHELFYFVNNSHYLGKLVIKDFFSWEDEKNRKVWWEFVNEEEKDK